jgi:hypothetical protein
VFLRNVKIRLDSPPETRPGTTAIAAFLIALASLTPACSSGGGAQGSGGTSGGGRRADVGAVGGATVSSTGGAGGLAGGLGGHAVKGGAGGSADGVPSGGTIGHGGTIGSGGGMGTGGLSNDAGGMSGGSAGNGSGGAAGRDGGADAIDVRDANHTTADASIETAADAASIPGTNNPVLPGYTADPNIVVFDGTFYLYPTTDGFADWGATSFSVFSSTNLVQWSHRGVVLDIPTALTWGKGHGWAPSVTRVGSTYYFYFSADSQLGVATGQSPTGPFEDALGKPLATTRQYGPQSIDPYAFLDDDGTPYLYFGSGSGGLLVAKLGANMTSFSGAPTNISPSGASGTLEGSAMFKRKGTYYLVWSEGDTRVATYQMAYARAQSPLGPFARLATILKQDTAAGILGPGGGTVLAIASRDEYYVVYHRFKIPGGDGTHRETCIDRMSFNSDGTIVPVKPTLAGLQIAVSP